jgi:Clathrin adaptor complex small chain
VEILDHYFNNVCELDLVFNFHKVQYIVCHAHGRPVLSVTLH